MEDRVYFHFDVRLGSENPHILTRPGLGLYCLYLSEYDNTMNQDPFVTEQTLQWIRSFVVEYNICPFAKQVIQQESLLIQVSQTTEPDRVLDALRQAMCWLDDNPRTETILLVLPACFANFFDYLDFVDEAEAFLLEWGYEGTYQLATFHPNYCFADADEDDVSNYTNRSPYPMLHVLRESSIEKAIHYYGDTIQIPENNIKTLRALGLEKVNKLLQGLRILDRKA